MEAFVSDFAAVAASVGVLASALAAEALVVVVGGIAEALPTVFDVVLVRTLRFGVGITISRSLHLQLRLELSVEYKRR